MSKSCYNQDKITLIQEDIIQLDKLISQLQRKRSVLLRRLNSAQSATRNLPPETLSLVFERYIASSIHLKATDYLGLLTIGHVSSYWRQVLWSTPHLWSSLHLSIHEKNAHGLSGILGLHLRNVGNFPFNLNLELSSPTSDSGKPIKDILTKYSTKIHGLGLSYLPRKWFSALKEFSSLQWISVSGGSNQGQLVLTESPQLRHVTLRNLHSDIQLPWKTVTTLILDCLPTYKCAIFLTQCPNLVYFSSEGRCPSTLQPNTDPTITPGSMFKFPTPITLSQLQDFHWPYSSSPWDKAVFQHVRLPALSELKLDFDHTMAKEGVQGDILALFHNLEDTLQVLTLGQLRRWTIPFAKNIFGRSPSLRKMTLSIRNGTSLSPVLHVLSLGLDGNTTFLPLLNDLTIKCPKHHPFRPDQKALKPELSSQILDFCRARSIIRNFKVSFHLGSLELTWAPGVLEELSTMVRDGFDLYIQHSCYRVVTWLS